MKLLKWFALWWLTRKAVKLHKKGNSVKVIIAKYRAEPRVSNGMVMLGITNADLKDSIFKKVKK